MSEISESTPVYLEEFLRLHPADVADRIQQMPVEEAKPLLEQLPTGQAASVLSELERENAVEILYAFEDDALIQLFKRLPPNEVTDLIAQLPSEKRRNVLAGLPDETAEHVQDLLRYPEDSAGGIMTDRFITLRSNETVGESLERLRQKRIDKDADVSYLYVTDFKERLVGVVPLREIVFGHPDRQVESIMVKDVKFVRVDDDQEEIARQFERYHFLGLPVLDALGRMVGVVKVSDALEVAQAEATEDMQLMVGLSGEEHASTPWQRSLAKRLPWLYLNLATAFLAAIVVGLFESTIAQWTALAIFLPIIAGQGGNAGMQTLTVIIRDMALGHLLEGQGRRALVKELFLGLINGLAVGVVVGLIGWLWKDSVTLGVVAGSAMVLNQVAAALSGVVIPFGLKMMKVDPALASSIFLTTVTDVAGFFFFLGLAFFAMQWYGV